MALIKSNELNEDVPKDAVKLTEREAVTYIWEIVQEWDNPSDVWAVRYGAAILGGVNSLSGILINSHYRTRLRLGKYGHFSSLLPIVLLPGMFTGLFHRQTVTTDLLLRKKETCPICYEMRSALIQVGFGSLYPLLLAPTSAFMFANRYSTYRIPSLNKEPRELFQFWKKITKPLQNTIVFFLTFQLVISSIVTYFEMRNILTMNRKIQELERKLNEEKDM